MEAEIEKLMSELPDRHAARRFIETLSEKHPRQYTKLKANEGLLSDVATLAAFSPLLAATMLQNPEYLWWLDRERAGSGIRSKEELMESFARFAMTHSQVDTHVLFARFRRRELLRIYLRDIRRQAMIAEITEEISNLADAILESAVTLAVREMENRFGKPLETDEKGRSLPARFCVVALGKLGSRELNYSSDIDLIFLYTSEGKTSGRGSRGAVTNREYFVKLAEYTIKLIGERSGEGAAYRVDVRLRPHGTLGALALSIGDTIRYYKTEARRWERQVMIRSRGCAGSIELFKEFFAQIEDRVFSRTETVESALANVRRSKEKIDMENISQRGYNVKLGQGGIREIEFIAQALQLAYGGSDEWLRSPHTLISIARLTDRHHLTAAELTELSSAYEFLRRTEHILQMENGVQTHTIPDDPERRLLLANKMTFSSGGDFENDLVANTENVSRIFSRVFGEIGQGTANLDISEIPNPGERRRSHVLASIDKSDTPLAPDITDSVVLERLAEVSPHFAAMLAANPQLVVGLPDADDDISGSDYRTVLFEAVSSAPDLRHALAALRRTWARLLLDIAVHDVFETVTMVDARRLQTALAEASIAAALEVVRLQMSTRYGIGDEPLKLAVLALGKLGGRGLDYGSDLDLVLVYDDEHPTAPGVANSEFYGRAVEMFVNALSSMTRDGNLYRVDLRLRPFGSKGLSAISGNAFIEYMRETAAVWEMLAFVKLRAVGGDMSLGERVETETRQIIHERAVSAGTEALRKETQTVRLALEKKRGSSRRSDDIDIKYGAGGMLDIYFAMRYLQLRDNIPDEWNDRSTPFMLNRLLSEGSLTNEVYAAFIDGYNFLTTLDHNIRLTIGRTTRVPLANQAALAVIAERMNVASLAELLEHLTIHRLNIRSAFENSVG